MFVCTHSGGNLIAVEGSSETEYEIISLELAAKKQQSVTANISYSNPVIFGVLARRTARDYHHHTVVFISEPDLE